MKAIRIFTRNVRDSFKSVFRNFSLSLASISCITITLIVVAIAIILSQNVNNFTELVESDVTIVAFLKRDVTEEQTVNKLEELEKNNEQEEKDIQENASLKIKDNAVLKNKLSYMNKNEDIAYQYTSLKNGIKEEIITYQRRKNCL